MDYIFFSGKVFTHEYIFDIVINWVINYNFCFGVVTGIKYTLS